MSIPFPDLQPLLERFQSIPEEGSLWLAEQRTLLLDTAVLAAFRNDLVNNLGVEQARGLLMRMGASMGRSDAHLVRRLQQVPDQAFLLGPQLHSLRGMVHVRLQQLEFQPEQGHFYAEVDWLDSFEASQPWPGHEPACWLLLGYACAYSSHLTGMEIQYREVACENCGDSHCRIIGKPADHWADSESFRALLAPTCEPEADSLPGLLAEGNQPAAECEAGQEVRGSSAIWQQTLQLLDRGADSDANILLGGETGTGKELMARRVHAMSRRSSGPFVALNCATLPPELIESELFGVEKGAFTGAHQSRPGRFERAHGGTLFLDEIMELPLRAQAALLRVLQEGELEPVGGTGLRQVDVRLVTATHANLEEAVRNGRFRADLFYRINAYRVVLPPLRQRRPDIMLLASHFLTCLEQQYGRRTAGFSPAAREALLAHDWPGNVRELENLVQRAVLLTDQERLIEPLALFGHQAESLDADAETRLEAYAEHLLERGVQLDQLEASLLGRALDRADGNVSAAARLLGLTRPAFAYRYRRQH